MKKQKLGLSKLSLTKSRIAELNTNSVNGGNRTSTAPNCIFTGPLTGCVVSENCPGGGTNGSCNNNCQTNDPTCNTQAILSCAFPC
ncbi:hypothetical protein [uncultured Kordia sp.]|uniref:hypothetical protein n=1 Tax=uncultured Kordia sp. TaxID=507699 RepID=UPI00261F3D9E|nr:hypothetical protein [uncultured Kordia sp.]